jgi:hypothetical protein
VEDAPDFPAYSRLRTASLPMRGAATPQISRGIPTLGTFVTTQSVTAKARHFALSGQVISAWLLMSP